MSGEIDTLKSQLKVARDEISNLRSQLNSLNHVHRKETELIRNILKDFKCGECSIKEDESASSRADKPEDNSIKFTPIGYVKTIFKEKRAIPRQASVAETILSKIEINKDLYSNPELSLSNLDEFSHIWIIYYFHKNEAHMKPKVYPPRLGEAVGVFATRSPHRPNLIGMSLVKLDRIEGSTIYFYGTDMLDATPVLDIKPYIPSYDSPQKTSTISFDSPNKTQREDPDGEENLADALTSSITISNENDSNEVEVKVPDWITNDNSLTVVFSDKASDQVKELNVNQKSIEEILKHDPRSVYVRQKYLSQIYSFQIDGKNVMCKFDDKIHSVTVLQVKNLMDMSTD